MANENVLNADGTLNGTPASKWTPIGKNTTSTDSYTGTLDGKGHTIRGLYVNEDSDYSGLFAKSKGTIKNINIKDSYIKGNYYVASFVGYGYSNCVISNCSSNARIEGTAYNGGIAGETYGKIENCYFAGKLTSTSSSTNAVVSDYYNRGTITNCYYIDTCGLTSTRATAKTAEEFASGEVCYLLNNGVTDGTQIWYQNIDLGETDSLPTLDNSHYTVYKLGTDYTNKTFDVNKDGKRDNADVAYILKYASGTITEEQIPDLNAADVNNDGSVDVLDAISLMNILA